MKKTIAILMLIITGCMDAPSVTDESSSLTGDEVWVPEVTDEAVRALLGDYAHATNDGCNRVTFCIDDSCQTTVTCCTTIGDTRCCQTCSGAIVGGGFCKPMQCGPSGPTAPHNPPSAPFAPPAD